MLTISLQVVEIRLRPIFSTITVLACFPFNCLRGDLKLGGQSPNIYYVINCNIPIFLSPPLRYPAAVQIAM